MLLKKVFATPRHSTFADIALLLLRLAAGVAMATHGWGKIQHAFSWMGAEAPVPGVFQFLAAFSEFGGGIAWAIGAIVPLASLGIAFTMLVAASFHLLMNGDPFVASGPGQPTAELAVIYLMIALVLMSDGPGRFSVDRQVFGSRE